MGAWMLSDYNLGGVGVSCEPVVPWSGHGTNTGDLHTLAATSKKWGNNVQQKSWEK